MNNSLCKKHVLPYENAWCVGERTDTIARLIDDMKFNRILAGCDSLASILASSLPEMPPQTIIVPIPTTPKNIRRRGYDHMDQMAKRLASIRNLTISPLLIRRNNLTQHFATSAKVRRQQATSFFGINPRQSVHPDIPYLIIDDIFTTGSTVRAAAACLRAHGATTVYVAVVARQPWK